LDTKKLIDTRELQKVLAWARAQDKKTGAAHNKLSDKDIVNIVNQNKARYSKSTSSRIGWDEAFKKMHKNEGDKSLMADVF
jgi:hypothetical protein